MKRSLIFAGLLALVLILGGASTWEGTAIVGGAEDFPGDGLYAACNSFPHNTSVVVTNLETGSSVTVVVTSNVDNPGVFISMAPKAAASIGMQEGTAARVRAVASIESPQVGLPATRAGETSDPDYNPRVFMERDQSAQAAAEAAPAAAGSAPTSGQSADSSAAQMIEEAAATAAPAAAKPATASAPATEQAQSATTAEGSEPGMASSTAEAPQTKALPEAAPELVGGSIPRPPRTSEAGTTLAEPSSPGSGTGQEAASVVAIDRPPLQSSPPAVALVEPELGPENLPEEDLPRVNAPSAPMPDTHLAEIDVAAAGNPAASAASGNPPMAAATPPSKASDLVVGIAPTSPRPPAAAGSVVEPRAAPVAGAVVPPASAAPAQPPAGAVVLEGLAKGSYYVQIGVYETDEALQNAARNFAVYPLAVEKMEGIDGTSGYRLYVGPLSRDESGVVLLRVKSRGYRDAFLRAGT
ncbi:MAG: hypothetical protein ACLQMF_12600 [Rectinemataceae bacterium]